jgi:hypothetical protein
MRRREFIAGLSAAAGWPMAARAQPALPLVGRLGGAASTEDMGEPINFMKTGPGRSRLCRRPGLCVGIPLGELSFGVDAGARRRPSAPPRIRDRDKLIAGATAAKAATQTIAIVFLTGVDPVAFGLVASLRRRKPTVRIV